MINFWFVFMPVFAISMLGLSIAYFALSSSKEGESGGHKLSMKFILIAAISAVISAYISLNPWSVVKGDTAEVRAALLGQMGDFFGGMLNPILAFASFIALLYTIRLQTNEFKRSSAEQKELFNAATRQLELAEEQLRLAKESHKTQLAVQIVQPFFERFTDCLSKCDSILKQEYMITSESKAESLESLILKFANKDNSASFMNVLCLQAADSNLNGVTNDVESINLVLVDLRDQFLKSWALLIATEDVLKSEGLHVIAKKLLMPFVHDLAKVGCYLHATNIHHDTKIATYDYGGNDELIDVFVRSARKHHESLGSASC